MLLARTAESVRGGPASVWLWPTAISAGSGRALDGRSERRFPALLVVGGMIPATVRARSSNAVDQIGTGQPLGDTGQRLAARFTLIGLSARANA